jgi:hypothetical protein
VDRDQHLARIRLAQNWFSAPLFNSGRFTAIWKPLTPKHGKTGAGANPPEKKWAGQAGPLPFLSLRLSHRQ